MKTVCDQLKAWDAKPFLIPAMGSHGGGTAEGQSGILAGYGITKEHMGVPVMASMEAVSYTHLDVYKRQVGRHTAGRKELHQMKSISHAECHIRWGHNARNQRNRQLPAVIQRLFGCGRS